ncbi:chlorohydrolase [Streptococcus pneumoniae]|nr:chlorohydrolase [Streptococcus pneumoniae]
MKIKEKTRKQVAGCSKHGFEVVDETDEVRNIYLRQGEVDGGLKRFSKSIK